MTKQIILGIILFIILIDMTALLDIFYNEPDLRGEYATLVVSAFIFLVIFRFKGRLFK